MTKRIGEVLKLAREKKGLKAEEVAVLCNVTRGQYYQWEASAYILAKNLPALAKALHLKLGSLTRVNKRQVSERPVVAASEDAATAA